MLKFFIEIKLNFIYLTAFNKFSKSTLVTFEKLCIFAPLINRGRVPQNLITRLCL